MDETVIVIMLKDNKTGFLDKELGCYTLSGEEDFIYNTYAAEDENGNYIVYMKLTCDKDVNDWEYNAIFDYYDMDVLSPLVLSITEDEQQYNPTWLISFPFSDENETMEKQINDILCAHKKELLSVYAVIADKKDDYIDNDN